MQNLQSLTLNKVILIGASTGGPSLIQKIILSIDNLNDTTIVIAQHMAEGFIDSFANELNKISKHDISVVENNLTIFQLERWFEILYKRREQAINLGMDPKMVRDIFELIHKYSILIQSKIMKKK